jgi:hypothetical protein
MLCGIVAAWGATLRQRIPLSVLIDFISKGGKSSPKRGNNPSWSRPRRSSKLGDRTPLVGTPPASTNVPGINIKWSPELEAVSDVVRVVKSMPLKVVLILPPLGKAG